MARLGRVVIPHIPHHIIQRGNRRQKTFFTPQDYKYYIDLLAEWSEKCSLKIWAYCLMNNHVHFIAVPSKTDSLRLAISEVHERYTRRINFRNGWKGHLWQGRFLSYPMDDNHLLHAARYIELNPVAAGMVRNPEQYPWSSAKPHLTNTPNMLIKDLEMVKRVPRWKEYLLDGVKADESKRILSHEHTGRPSGTKEFITKLEIITGRSLSPRKPGPKPKSNPTPLNLPLN